MNKQYRRSFALGAIVAVIALGSQAGMIGPDGRYLLRPFRPRPRPRTTTVRPPAPQQTDATNHLRYNQVYRLTTHNSYWVNRNNIPEPYASGVQERILDQLLFEHVRGLEIDIHKDTSQAGLWDVYHTDARHNSFCSTFPECLKQLQQFQYALPSHEVVTVVIELKELKDYNFDSRHRPSDFDALLEKYLGPHLYRPRDFLARCAPGSTMRQCAASQGWPTIEELRGKFIFAIEGNWHTCQYGRTIGHGSQGWATYATDQGGVAERAAFPMISDYVDMTHTDCNSEYVEPAQLASAADASVFDQVELTYLDSGVKAAQAFVAAGGIVRGHDSWTVADQQTRVSSGFQVLMTDYPWLQFNEQGIARPFKAFDPAKADSPELDEPGNRLALTRYGDGSGFVFAATRVAGSSSDWETLPSTTRPSPDPAYANPHWTRGKGCLRASNGKDFFTVCRQTVEGHWYKPKPKGEDIAITVEYAHGHEGHKSTWYSDADSSEGAGDQIRLTTAPHGRHGVCVTAYTAAELTPWGAPAWKTLKTKCFKSALDQQGVSAQWGDVVFFNTKHNGAQVGSADLGADTSGTGYDFRDLSVPAMF